MMVRDTTREDVVRHAGAAARRYCQRSGDDAEEIVQRILATVSVDVRDGVADWPLVVIAVRNAIASIARFDRRARRCCDLPVMVAHSGIVRDERITEQERIELRMDIETCLAKEGQNVRRLCGLLQQMTLAEAAREMGIARRTARGWIASLRERMEAKGLRGG
jgi:DNA-directed RNA polymerase specialized sigma24 family protein